jgi:hypothetical protein
MSEIIRAECPTKYLGILPFDYDIVEDLGKQDNGAHNVVVEFEDDNLQPQDGLRICADLHGPKVMALLLFNGTRNLRSWPLVRQIENDPEKKGQPTYVMGVVHADLKPPRRINVLKRKGRGDAE